MKIFVDVNGTVLVVDAERLAWFAANAVNACATGRLSVKVPLFAVLEVL